MVAKHALLATVVVCTASSAFGIASESPYKAIIERNVFGLNPPPPPQTNSAAEAEAPVNIKFTGITTLGQEKKAWFIVTSKDPKEPPTYLSLLTGERSGAVEVREIFDSTGEVKVVTGGREMTLSFKEHGNKANAVAISGPAPAAGGIIPPPPPGRSAISPPGVPAANASTFTSGGGNYTPSGNTAMANNSSAGLMNIPTRPLRTGIQPETQPTQTPVPGSQMSLEERVALHEVEKIVNQPLVDKGLLPPVPSIVDEDPNFKFPQLPGGPPTPGAPPVPR